ncbi:MAG: ABC transporter ATP-binding protein [Coriobacteriales bacterium]|nr:ABC transporter ATP-binding protein [Coriobacteriales bacterium]
MLLEVCDLRITDARDKTLVAHANLSLKAGQALGLVGETGCGKTLTVRACLGLLPPRVMCEATRLMLMGYDMQNADANRVRTILGRHVGFVPQNTMAYLHPRLKVRTQMIDGYLTWHKGVKKAAAYERARELLESVGIKDTQRVLNCYPQELSGGMRQRVNIASALMGNPSLVVADEPTAALDSVTQQAVADVLLAAVHRQQSALLLVSHDLELVRSRCDSVAVMYAGRIVEVGPCKDVLHNPGHPYTQALIDAVPRVSLLGFERLCDVAGSMPEKNRESMLCAFAPRCPRARTGCFNKEVSWQSCDDSQLSEPHEAWCLHAWEDAKAPESEGVLA